MKSIHPRYSLSSQDTDFLQYDQAALPKCVELYAAAVKRALAIWCFRFLVSPISKLDLMLILNQKRTSESGGSTEFDHPAPVPSEMINFKHQNPTL